MRLPLETPPEHAIPGESAAVESCEPLPVNGDAARDVPKPEVLLDLWHAKRRILDAARTTHGAYLPFCNALTKAFTIADPRAVEDLRTAVARLNPTMEPWEVEGFLLRNYGVVLKHAPRVIPQPDILTPRFDDVVKMFRGIPDITTGEQYATLFA